MRVFSFLAVFALSLLVCAQSQAEMGPRRGLPKLWNMTPTRGYGVLNNIVANPISAMCVDCHTANPSAGISNPVLPFGESETLYRGSHFVRNNLDSIVRTTQNTAIEVLTPWSSGGSSKYGDFTNVVSVVGATGDLICESCHNIVKNRGNSLLLGDYQESTGVADMCEMCHMNESGGPPEHHPMSGHIVGLDREVAGDHALNVNHTSHVKNPPYDVTKTLNVAFFSAPAPKAMTCVSCHKPHDAMTATGARILRRGASGSSDAAISDKQVNVTNAANVPVNGLPKGSIIAWLPAGATGVTGLHRQSDMGAGYRLVFNSEPLCSACHKRN